MDENFEELSNDVDLISRLKQFSQATTLIHNTIKLACNPEIYDALTNKDKIKFNSLMSYSLNSLFWMYLRAEGIDPTKHQIKLENDRLKKSMARAKQINDRQTIMPRVNKNVANRFVRSSLWEPRENRKRPSEESTREEEGATEDPDHAKRLKE